MGQHVKKLVADAEIGNRLQKRAPEVAADLSAIEQIAYSLDPDFENEKARRLVNHVRRVQRTLRKVIGDAG
jgi:hypothetical protein